jgi:hypothetical protein
MPKILTYEQFRQILVHLGFNEVAAPGYTIYRNEDHDATLVIPDVSPVEPVHPVHLVAARELILGKGIKIGKEFRRLLTPPSTDSIHLDNTLAAIPGNLRPAKISGNPETGTLNMIDDRKRALQAKLRKVRSHKERNDCTSS